MSQRKDLVPKMERDCLGVVSKLCKRSRKMAPILTLMKERHLNWTESQNKLRETDNLSLRNVHLFNLPLCALKSPQPPAPNFQSENIPT